MQYLQIQRMRPTFRGLPYPVIPHGIYAKEYTKATGYRYEIHDKAEPGFSVRSLSNLGGAGIPAHSPLS